MQNFDLGLAQEAVQIFHLPLIQFVAQFMSMDCLILKQSHFMSLR